MIEPCCIDNQLPEAVRDQKGRAIVATSGDVLAHHWFKAISYQAGNKLKMRLQVKIIDIKLLRYLRSWMQRGWVKQLQITTASNQAELIAAELGTSSEECISIAADELMQSELMALEGEDGLVMIIGPILTEKRPGATLYTVYSKRDYTAVSEVLAVIDSRHRSHRISNNNNNEAYELDSKTEREESAEAQVEGAEPDGKRVRNNRKAGSRRNDSLGRKKQKDVSGAATGTADDAEG